MKYSTHIHFGNFPANACLVSGGKIKNRIFMGEKASTSCLILLFFKTN